MKMAEGKRQDGDVGLFCVCKLHGAGALKMQLAEFCFDRHFGSGMRKEEEKCKGARTKYLYLCGGVILPSGASLHSVAAGNHVRQCSSVTR
jgi:hypothetical protein